MFSSRRSLLFGAMMWFGAVNAHLAAWHKGMYCLNGVDGSVDLNSAAPVTPLYQLPRSQWWFHHVNNCDGFPPPDGDYVDLPAGGSFSIEIGSNRAKTSLSYGGRDMSDWPDGNTYPEDYNVPSCIISPNMHAQNQSRAAGTAFAISYQSDIKQVTPENLVVFTVRYNTPWKRIIRYDVPAALPACPPGGCICAWGWVPNGCGQPNMYHQPFKCRVSNAKSTTPVGRGKAPVWCEGNPGACTKGPKQMIYWNQNDGNNIYVDGFDQNNDHKSPGYNMKCGFPDGAQNDIFTGAPSYGSSSPNSNNNDNGNSGAGSSSGTPTPANSGDGNTPPSSGSGTSASAASATQTSDASLLGPQSVKAPSCQKKRRRRRAVVDAAVQYRSVHHRRSPVW